MAIYNPESLSAEEFINHDEILETLQYAKANKNNIELIDSILEKARPKHYADGRTMHCPGLTHRVVSTVRTTSRTRALRGRSLLNGKFGMRSLLFRTWDINALQ